MPMGVTVMGGDVALAARAAALAEEAGFDSAWSAEFYDRSATVSLAAMAAATTRIRVGSAIAYAFGRAPMLTVAEARDLDELSGGRFVLGLGSGTRAQIAGWLGMDAAHPAARIEELLPLLRRLWRAGDEPVVHEGRFFRLRLEPTLDIRRPRAADLSIYVAGVRPRMVEAAGRVGDGLVGHPLFTREYVAEVVRPALERGARRAGRAAVPPVAGYVLCAVSEDAGRARREAAGQVAFYSVVRAFEPIMRMHGFEREVAAVREAFGRRDLEGMAAGVSERMLDTFAVTGTPAEARQRFAERFAGVHEEPLLFFPCLGVGRDRLLEGVEAIVETFELFASRDIGRGLG